VVVEQGRTVGERQRREVERLRPEVVDEITDPGPLFSLPYDVLSVDSAPP
jgi:hypothetical protein